MISSKKYDYIPLVEIQSNTHLKQKPLDHIVVFTNYPVDKELERLNENKGLGFSVKNVDIFEQTNYDLNLLVFPGEELKVIIKYNAMVYGAALIKHIADHLINITKQVTTDPGIQVSEIEILSESERNRLIYGLNNENAEYPRDKTIHYLFEEQVVKIEDNVAVIGMEHGGRSRRAEVSLTYRELNQKANQVARILSGKGVKADTVVGIMVERSIEMIVGIMAILKSGGAYLPIDPEYPEERIKFMLEDSGAEILLSTKDLRGKVDFKRKFYLEDKEICFEDNINLKEVSRSVNLAYIIFTSGSTGKPKGVMIEHRNVVSLMYIDKFDFDSNDVWTMFHSYCFDFSVWEMYGALLYGGKLVIIPRMKARDPKRYLDILKKQKVTVVNQTPSAFYNLIDEELKNPERELNIKYIIFGGEALKPAQLKEWKKKYLETKLINMYGITETTVHVTFKEIKDKEIESNISNIGKPIPTLKTCIMDKNLKLLPIGAPGEVCVGGEGVGRGYLNKPELTAAKFVENPYRPGEILYKSRDLVRLLSSGEMEYLHRIDSQVKVRGFRIELEEIENQLLKHNKIKEAVVIATEVPETNTYGLCAYIVSDREFRVSELREYLLMKLPDYMVPSYFVRIEKMPLTTNGKIDRKVLILNDEKLTTGVEYAAPENEIEKVIADIWKEVLNVDKVGIYDNFFDLGGNSITVIRLNSRLNEVLEMNIPVVKMYKYLTIRSFVEYLNRKETEEVLFNKEIEGIGTKEKASQRRQTQKMKRRKVERLNV
jgi:amino acid adenylation domain-containing protein